MHIASFFLTEPTTRSHSREIFYPAVQRLALGFILTHTRPTMLGPERGGGETRQGGREGRGGGGSLSRYRSRQPQSSGRLSCSTLLRKPLDTSTNVRLRARRHSSPDCSDDLNHRADDGRRLIELDVMTALLDDDESRVP